MRKTYVISLLLMLLCIGCEWQLKPNSGKEEGSRVTILRYDRLQSLYLTTGDYSALQQMNTEFPMQTRTLIEDVLHLGRVNDPTINARFLAFYQDSTLQRLISDVQHQFADVDDLNKQLTECFGKLKKEMPAIELPQIYTQIGTFDQSIIVGNGMLGISLDKYLGADYPFYVANYSDEQRRMMTRSMIVPDCLGFFILSLFPMPADHELTQDERDHYMGCIQWEVNRLIGKRIFRNPYVQAAERNAKRHPGQTLEQLLTVSAGSLR